MNKYSQLLKLNFFAICEDLWNDPRSMLSLIHSSGGIPVQEQHHSDDNEPIEFPCDLALRRLQWMTVTWDCGCVSQHGYRMNVYNANPPLDVFQDGYRSPLRTVARIG